jgi:hypothetical protein
MLDCTLITPAPRARDGTAQVTQNSAKLPRHWRKAFSRLGSWINPADQGEAAQRHAVAVEVKELIVQLVDQRQPQLGEGLGRHPRLGLRQQRGSMPTARSWASRACGRSRRAWSMALRSTPATESLSRMAGSLSMLSGKNARLFEQIRHRPPEAFA